MLGPSLPIQWDWRGWLALLTCPGLKLTIPKRWLQLALLCYQILAVVMLWANRPYNTRIRPSVMSMFIPHWLIYLCDLKGRFSVLKSASVLPLPVLACMPKATQRIVLSIIFPTIDSRFKFAFQPKSSSILQGSIAE